MSRELARHVRCNEHADTQAEKAQEMQPAFSSGEAALERDAEERRSLRNRVVGLGVRLYAQVGRSVAAGGLELIDSQSQSQPRGRMDMAS